ncbi:MAG: hypothetical protein IPJ37_17255 [Bacteroidales bacterium]|nr:hypothetical protein [Bacteroidales bacterium]
MLFPFNAQGFRNFMQYSLFTKSGEQILVETRISHGTWNGKPAIFAVSKDITAAKMVLSKHCSSVRKSTEQC